MSRRRRRRTERKSLRARWADLRWWWQHRHPAPVYDQTGMYTAFPDQLGCHAPARPQRFPTGLYDTRVGWDRRRTFVGSSWR